MKWIKTFENFDANELGLKLSFEEWIKASNLAELNFESLFKTYDTDLEHLLNTPDFMEELSRRNLIVKELHNSKDIAHLLDTNIQFAFIVFADKKNPNIQEPKYVLIQNEEDKIRLFYNVEDVNRFHEKLSSRIIKVKEQSTTNEYIYMTSNGGMNWILQNTEDETDLFKKEISGETLIQMQTNNKVEIKITN